ncbi:MAG: hypothetical protein VX700_12315, partial [Pseudomonadota bacterium]|nr:hypothetical protein [Pseudomonadota bacterium]
MSGPGAYIIVQARMGSSRFPGKTMAEIAGKPTLWYLFRQLSFCKTIDGIVLATTDNKKDDALATYGKDKGWNVFRGSESDVLGRYYNAALQLNPSPLTAIVRLTGDDILTDPLLIDGLVSAYKSMPDRLGLVTTDQSNRLPYGAQIEICSFAALAEAHANATSAHEREHVFPYIRARDEQFPVLELKAPEGLPLMSLSIDHPTDLEKIRQLIKEMNMNTKPPYHLHDVLRAIEVL